MKSKTLRTFLVFITLSAWFFSGFPQIWPLGKLGVNTIRIPPKIQEAQAVVAYDTFSNVAAGTGNLSWTHTPVGTPRGVIVLIIQVVGAEDQVSSVTYGSLSLTRTGRACDTVTEPGCVYAYFGGSSVPTGAQTVTVTVSGSRSKRAAAITLTGTVDTEVVTYDQSITANATNPTVSLNLQGRTSFVAEALYSGLGTVNSITPFNGWTSRLEYDWGNYVGGWYTYNTVGSDNVSAGWTQSSDDAAMVALAVSEINNAPSLTVSQPDGTSDTVIVGQSYNITYDLSDSDSVATVDFYYDSNGSGTDGTAITGCQDQAEGTGATCSWNTTGMTAGSYYVYGIATDGVNPDVNDYSPGTITIQAAVVSVSISDATVTYNMMPANTSKTTLSGELNDMQTATNDGNVTENFNIKSQDATGGGCTWTLASTNGNNQYVHQFCNDTDYDCASPPTNYTALTTGYQTLKTGVTTSGTVNFQLRLTTPTDSSCFNQQSVDVTIQAVQQ